MAQSPRPAPHPVRGPAAEQKKKRRKKAPTPPTARPQTTPAWCPRNCGQSQNGGGTWIIRSSGTKCTSCNVNRLLVSVVQGPPDPDGLAHRSGLPVPQQPLPFLHPRGRRGHLPGLIDGECQASCPPTTASSGVGLFKRRCAAPFTCQSGRLLVSPAVNYGCKCATEDNSAIAACQIC